MEYQNQEIEFRQIVLKHIQKILELSTSELRDKTYTIQHQNHSSITEQEDTRLSYIQSIENLAYVLLPYFDKKMTSIYEECIEVIQGFDHEVRKLLQEEHDEICKEIGKTSLGKAFAVEMKLRYSKKMFVALNLLLNRNDYLKSAVYGEESDEVITDEDQE